MSGLLAALHRLEGRNTPPFASFVEPVSTAEAEPEVHLGEPADGAREAVIEVDAAGMPRGEHADFVSALTSNCPPPSLLAFVGIGLEESLTATLRELAEAVVRQVGRDVVLLGPGLLDDRATLTAHWAALSRRAAYGFLHASAEYAAGRLDGLRGVTAVVPVVELGRSSGRAVAALRRLLLTHAVPIVGGLVVEIA